MIKALGIRKNEPRRGDIIIIRYIKAVSPQRGDILYKHGVASHLGLKTLIIKNAKAAPINK